MSLNKSTSDAEIPTGTVLFAAGQMKSQYSNVKEKAETETKGKRKKKALEEDIPKKKKVRHTTIKDISQPNPTKTTTAEEDLSNLIMAWYYAGYYTALYSEQHK
ncbi:hypothetical protein G6F70_001830 [Rhizopus microsporus]|nr:hypothetical protein G6F71_002030 [Rhizopus microsporus]KAG1202907.1 hypothetical protein G6F70_001830 [Rhizopus microsporus]KAG1214949.1 hypothetical protein G6F69_001475 [Rhizopus microsporus]KAG1237135.1 hypothetical protein G6F67_001430 [Rhizopus microsporus]KAG1258578.1 hypothetical protein G6F68_008689 [Rhizopus microsporus]